MQAPHAGPFELRRVSTLANSPRNNVPGRIANAVNTRIPIDAVCSVDELCCVLGARDGAEDVGRRIKARLREAVGPRVTCSMGLP